MDLNIQTLRIFCQVVETGSFSGAARNLKIAQPTVSQQVARIESLADGRLFERVGKSIHLTSLGKEFYRFASDIIDKSDEFYEQIRSQKSTPTGLVKYAMPESCQWTPHFRKIMSQVSKFPKVKFEIEILPNREITQKILQGQIDFGFVTGERLSPDLKFEKFSDESYSLVAKDKKQFESVSSQEYQNLRIIAYPGWELFFEVWAKSNGLWNKLKNKITSPTLYVGTISGALHALQEGAGIGVMPNQCIQTEVNAKELIMYKSAGVKDVSSPVHIVRRLGEKAPRRVEIVIEMLKTSKSI